MCNNVSIFDPAQTSQFTRVDWFNLGLRLVQLSVLWLGIKGNNI